MSEMRRLAPIGMMDTATQRRIAAELSMFNVIDLTIPAQRTVAQRIADEERMKKEVDECYKIAQYRDDWNQKCAVQSVRDTDLMWLPDERQTQDEIKWDKIRLDVSEQVGLWLLHDTEPLNEFDLVVEIARSHGVDFNSESYEREMSQVRGRTDLEGHIIDDCDRMAREIISRAQGEQ